MSDIKYLTPRMECSAKLFLKNERGDYIKWPASLTPSGRCITSAHNNNYALEIKNCEADECRETLCNDFREIFTYDLSGALNVPIDCIATLIPPLAPSGKPLISTTSSLSLLIEAPGNESKNNFIRRDSGGADFLIMRAGELAKVRRNQAQLFEMLDALLGSVAMLIASPKAYTQKTKNTTVPAKSWKGNILDSTENLKIWNATLKYKGISNFWLKHPALMSFVLGLMRYTMDAWCEGLYEKFDKALDLKEMRKYLKELNKDEKLEKGDRKELMGVLQALKPLLLSPKVRANPGAFPLNEYTWGMFLKLIRHDFKRESLSRAWRQRKHNIYTDDCTYGFVAWCEDRKNKTKKFNICDSKRWGEYFDNQISLFY